MFYNNYQKYQFTWNVVPDELNTYKNKDTVQTAD